MSSSHFQYEDIEAGQNDEQVRRVYQLLKDEPKVRWKESYCVGLGLEQTVDGG